MKDSGLQVLDCGFLVSGTWISDFSRSRIPDSLSFTTDSEDHDFRLYKQKFPGFHKSGLLYMGRYISSIASERGHETKKHVLTGCTT